MRNITRRASIILMMVCMVVAFMPVLGQGHAHAASIKLSNTKVYLVKGDKFKLKVKGTKAKVKWSSSNKKVATVSKGKIKAKKNGKATITAKVKGKKLKCKVVVQKASKNAKALRAYVLKKGVKSGGERGITKEIPRGDEGKATLGIYAKSSSKVMSFYWDYKVGTPDYEDIVGVDINLISGKGTGDFHWRSINWYEEQPCYDAWNGIISTKFDGKSKGMRLNSRESAFVYYDEEEGRQVDLWTETDPEVLKNGLGSACETAGNALSDLRVLVNKAGTTMKSIGFKNL